MIVATPTPDHIAYATPMEIVSSVRKESKMLAVTDKDDYRGYRFGETFG